MLNKKLVLCVALLAGALGLATSASASIPGFYLGGQAGYGSINYGNVNNAEINSDVSILSSFGIPASSTNNNRTGGLAGRFFGGYQIDTNWGVELGYTQFSTLNQKQTGTFTLGTGAGTTVVSEYDKRTVKTNAIDLVAKGTLPVENGFSVYGKAGLAYVTAKSSDAVQPTGLTTNPNQTAHRFLPTGTLGLQYDITPQLSADVSYTRIQKTGHSNLIQSTNFVGAGLAYHFG